METQSIDAKIVKVDYESIKLADKNNRLHEIVMEILPLFKIANFTLVLMLIALTAIDVIFISTKIINPTDRIIGQEIVLAYIAATAAEISAIIIAAIAKFK